jgi:hypothetical protein
VTPMLNSDDTNNPELVGEKMYAAIRDWVASAYDPDPCVVTRIYVIAECDDGETRWLEYGGYSADGQQLTEWETAGLLQHAKDARIARMVTNSVIDSSDDTEGEE